MTPNIVVKGWKVCVATADKKGSNKLKDVGRMYSTLESAQQLASMMRKAGHDAVVRSVEGVEVVK